MVSSLAVKKFQVILLISLINNILGLRSEASESNSEEDDFGLNPRIHGGVPAYHGEAPFAVALYVGELYVCTFTIISQRTVIGPAKCIMENKYKHYPPNSIRGRVGNINRKDGRLIHFTDVNIHKDYRGYGSADIATLITDREIMFDAYTNRILFAPTNLYLPGAIVDIYGWGSFINESKDYAESLQKVVGTILPHDECRDYSSRVALYSDNYICTLLAFPRYTSHGDAGAPVVYEYGNEEFLVGYLLYRDYSKSGLDNVIDINVAVNNFSSWIDSNICYHDCV